MTISETTTVGDVASAIPSSVRVFQQHGIDFCCGGRKPLAHVCRELGVDFNDVVVAIDASNAKAADDRDWSRESLGDLIAHIVTTYHRPLGDELPRLQAMASKVAQVHGGKSANLAAIRTAIDELAADLQAHMRKEELVLFPAIEALEAGRGPHRLRLGTPIAAMEHEHDHAGALLAELRQRTAGYEVPEWGCATVRAFFHGLAELEATMHVHVHLENNILFPRALFLAEPRVEA